MLKSRGDLKNMTDTITKMTYQQQVYNILEKRIVSGEMPPGQKILEQEIANSLGVSRSPVREALIQLSQLGLVRKTKKERWIVSEISLRDVIELYDLRKMMEVFAAKSGCLDSLQKNQKEMKDVLEKLNNFRNFDNDRELDNWRENAKRFHELIILSSGNKKLHELFIWTMKRLRWTNQLTMAIPGRHRQSMEEHQEIYEAFMRQDPKSLEKAICEHIEIIQKEIKSIGTEKRLFSKTAA